MLKIVLVSLLLLTAVGQAKVVTKEVQYMDGETKLIGSLVYDDATQEKRPGVLVVHEWWGRNEFAIQQATHLAEMGYAAFAVDIYGEAKTTNDPEEAGKLATTAKKNDWQRKRGLLALETLKQQEQVDPERLGAIGFCFGGTTVLEMMRAGVEGLDVVASFHGGLGTDRPAGDASKTTYVVIFHGEADPLVPAEEVAAVAKELINAGVGFTLVGLPGAKHAFTNPAADDMGWDAVGYNASAAEQSFGIMKMVFDKVFQIKN